LGLTDLFLVALAANCLGFDAPLKLFDGKRDSVRQLVREGLCQIVEMPGNEEVIRWFHPTLARRFYDLICPQANVEQRAIHLRIYCKAVFSDADKAKALVHLLAPRSAKKSRIPARLAAEALQQIWPILSHREPPNLSIRVVVAWIDASKEVPGALDN